MPRLPPALTLPGPDEAAASAGGDGRPPSSSRRLALEASARPDGQPRMGDEASEHTGDSHLIQAPRGRVVLRPLPVGVIEALKARHDDAVGSPAAAAAVSAAEPPQNWPERLPVQVAEGGAASDGAASEGDWTGWVPLLCEEAWDVTGESLGFGEEWRPKKKLPPGEMVRVGIGHGEYVLDVQHVGQGNNPNVPGTGRWDMSYRYVGPGKGQYSLLRQPAPVQKRPEADVRDRFVRLAPFLCILCAVILALVVVLIGSALRPRPRPVEKEPPRWAPLPSPPPAPTPAPTLVQTTTPDFSRHISVGEFAGRVLRRFSDGGADAWGALAGTSRSVPFPRFQDFAALLEPPLGRVQAWQVFAELDKNDDIELTEREFLDGTGLGPPTTTRAPVPSTTARAEDMAALGTSLRKFEDAVRIYWGSPYRAQRELYHDDVKASFPRFADFAAELWPPLNRTQAWFIFSLMDSDHDVWLEEREFNASMELVRSDQRRLQLRAAG